MAEAAKQIERTLDKTSNLSSLLEKGHQEAEDILNKSLESSVDLLHKHGIYDIDYKSFAHYAKEYFGNWNTYFGQLYDKYDELMEYKKGQQDYRRSRKAGRGRVIGGGFGLAGAAKGMAMAGGINAVAGLAHSFANGLGGAATSAEVNSRMRKIFKDPSTKGMLVEAMRADIFAIHFAVVDILNDKLNAGIPKLYANNEFSEAELIYTNIVEGKVNEDKVSDLFPVCRTHKSEIKYSCGGRYQWQRQANVITKNSKTMLSA